MPIRATRAVVLALVAVLGCAACTSSRSSPEPVRTTRAAPTAAATADPRVAPLRSDNPTAQAAYALASQVALRQQLGARYLRLPAGDLSPGDFDDLDDVLTDGARRTLDGAADSAATDAGDLDTVRAIAFVDFARELRGSGRTLASGDDVVANQRIAAPRYAFVDGDPTIRLTSSGAVQVVDEAGSTSAIPYAVRLELTMQDTDDGLRINAWRASWAFEGRQPGPLR